ncbi:hypothetical protein BaRGS_00037898, partial [Batillaria attramentaria]
MYSSGSVNRLCIVPAVAVVMRMSVKLRCFASVKGLSGLPLICLVWFALQGQAAGLSGHHSHGHYTTRSSNHHNQHPGRSRTPYYVNGKPGNHIINPSYNLYRGQTQDGAKPTPAQAPPPGHSVTSKPTLYVLNNRPKYVLVPGSSYTAYSEKDAQGTTKYPNTDNTGEYVYPISLEGDTISNHGGAHGNDRESARSGSSANDYPYSEHDQDPFSFLRFTSYDEGKQGQDAQNHHRDETPTITHPQQHPPTNTYPQQHTEQSYPGGDQRQSSIPGASPPRSDGDVRGSFRGDDVVAVTDCALLEEFDSDMMGRTHCLAAKTCSSIHMRR